MIENTPGQRQADRASGSSAELCSDHRVSLRWGHAGKRSLPVQGWAETLSWHQTAAERRRAGGWSQPQPETQTASWWNPCGCTLQHRVTPAPGIQHSRPPKRACGRTRPALAVPALIRGGLGKGFGGKKALLRPYGQ